MPQTNAVILLLNSAPLVRSVTAEALNKAGYVVRDTGDLGVAVEMLAETSIDLLIIAPYVEDIPGHEAAKYLREKNPDMAILFVAGLLDDDRLEVRAELEGFEIFPPPYTAAQLLAKVDEILKRHKP